MNDQDNGSTGEGEGRGGGRLGPFVLGVAVGVALGMLFAPEAGDATRGKVRRRLRGLSERAIDKAEELGGIVADAAEDLAERRARRAAARRGQAAEEDEPLE